MPYTQQQLQQMAAVLAGTQDKFVGPQLQPAYSLSDIYSMLPSYAGAYSEPTVPVRIAGGTIQMPASTQLPSGNYKTGTGIAGTVAMPSNYRPTNLPAAPDFDPLSFKSSGRPPDVPVPQTGALQPIATEDQRLAPSPAGYPALYGTVPNALAYAGVPGTNYGTGPKQQPAALQAIDVAEGVPLPRPRPSLPSMPVAPSLPVPTTSIVVRGGNPAPRVGAPIPAPAILRGSATGTPYEIGKTYQLGPRLMQATPTGFKTVYDPTIIGSGNNLLGGLIKGGINKANSGGLGGLLGARMGGGAPVARGASPLASALSRGGGFDPSNSRQRAEEDARNASLNPFG